MRILIAGGAGFIGFHLTERLLEAGHSVLVADNLLTGRAENVEKLQQAGDGRRLDFLPVDVCSMGCPPGRFDAVVHLASPASPRDYLRHPFATLDVGSLGTRNLLEIARRHCARFLLASTSEVYGDPLVHPQTESYWGHVNPIGPRSVYDEAKRFAEAQCAAYARERGLTVRLARIFNTYGPRMRMDDGRVIPSFIAQAIAGAAITVQGDGSQTRSYCYVDDLARGLDLLLWSDVEGPVNLGNPQEYTVLETAHVIRRVVGGRSPIRHLPLPEDDPKVRRPDITRARTLLGWEPSVPFEDGLRCTIQDFRRQLSPGRQISSSASVPTWTG